MAEDENTTETTEATEAAPVAVTLKSKLAELTATVDAKVAELNDRIPNSVNDKGKVTTERFANNVQVRKIVDAELVTCSREVLDLVAAEIMGGLKSKFDTL